MAEALCLFLKGGGGVGLSEIALIQWMEHKYWDDRGRQRGMPAALSFRTEMFIGSLILLRQFDSHQTAGVAPRTED